jgi:hypothetical protein
MLGCATKTVSIVLLFVRPGWGQSTGTASAQGSCNAVNTGNNGNVTVTCSNVDKKLADQIGQLVNASKRDGKMLKEISDKLDVLLKEPTSIRSLDIDVGLDLPTTPLEVSARSASMGLSSVIALFDDENQRFRFVTDFRFSEQQSAKSVHRFEFTYHPEELSQFAGRPMSALAKMRVFVFDYSEFLRIAGHSLDANGSANLSISLILNGIRVTLSQTPVPAEQIVRGSVRLDVSAMFASVESVYTRELSRRSQ